MTSRAWLPHPARTIRPPACPTGLPRYTRLHHAHAPLTAGLTDHPITAWECQQCDGAHITERSST